jgi:hypothetical protein
MVQKVSRSGLLAWALTIFFEIDSCIHVAAQCSALDWFGGMDQQNQLTGYPQPGL